MKIWLDDERRAPEGWVRIFHVIDAINLLESGEVDEISPDHDLGEHMNGYQVLERLERMVVFNKMEPPIIHIHTANPVARKRMEQAVKSIERFCRENASARTDE